MIVGDTYNSMIVMKFTRHWN